VLEPAPERVAVDEVRECVPTVDFDHRQELPVPQLELGPAADVDDVELEAELSPQPLDDLERPFAEAAVGGAVNRDSARYGYRPLVVVASATR
jgi:hypothetical protein